VPFVSGTFLIRFHNIRRRRGQLQHTPDVTVVEVMSADKSDPASREGSLYQAQTHLDAAGRDIEIQEVAADKGYHSTKVLNTLPDQTNHRTYIPEPKVPGGRNWIRYSSKQRKAAVNNRRRARGKKGS